MDYKKLFSKDKIKVKIKPNADENKVKGMVGDYLKVNISASPKRGEANKELIDFFKERFDKNIIIKAGKTSRKKLIRIK